VNVNVLLVSQPYFGEMTFDIVDHVDMIVVNSVTALVPRAELEGAMPEGAT
jgi:recombination protein RecA